MHHLHRFGDVTVMSAFDLIATELTLHNVRRNGPRADITDPQTDCAKVSTRVQSQVMRDSLTLGDPWKTFEQERACFFLDVAKGVRLGFFRDWLLE